MAKLCGNCYVCVATETEMTMLNHNQIESIKPTGKRERHFLGDGLYLTVSGTGRKSWAAKFRSPTGMVEKSIGKFPTMGVREARGIVSKMQSEVAMGGSAETVLNQLDAQSFTSYFKQWYETKATGPKSWSREYAYQAMKRFERYVLPTIGNKRIVQITKQDCLAVVKKIEDKGHIETARRVKDHMTSVFSYATFDGDFPNPMEGINTRLKARPEVKHMPTLEPKEMSEFFRRLACEKGLQRQTRALMEITIRTMVRTNEIRFGQWPEIEGDLWTIPASRMKMSRPHVVPLVPQVVKLFEELRDISNDPDEWGAHRGTNLRPKGDDMCAISENGMLFALYRMGYKNKATMHGFRSTASTYLYSTNKYRDAAIELQLAHKEKNKIKAAYDHHDYLDERWKLMRDWNRFLDEKKATGEILV